MDVALYYTLGILCLYVAGGWIDRRFNVAIFLGGLLPFIGYRTRQLGPLELRGFFTAWLWIGVCWKATLTNRD